MAVQHLAYSTTSTHGNLIRVALGNLESGLDQLVELLGVMARMIDGDGSQAAHFAYMTDKFGFASDAVAKAAWEELNSLKFKLTTNASVSDVNAAMIQAFDKLR